jgi:two-component system chemotaxis sensor kinase CheA
VEYSELIRDFLDDAAEHLNVFDGVLLSLEKNGRDKEQIYGALGALHTLKGNSGMMGMESLKGYIHRVEEVLKKTGDGVIRAEESVGLLLESANVLRKAFQAIGDDPSTKPDLSDETLALIRFSEGWRGDAGTKAEDLGSYLGSKTDTIRVDFKKLDSLLNLVGELLIFKTRLNQIESEIRQVVPQKSLSRELNAGLELMGKTIAGLQEGIMKARMLPVGRVFSKFHRMVRDLSKSQGKEVRLELEGEDTELDKTVIDELEEPLLHIIRNAIDHGIETPRERLAKGKNHQGTITLSAVQESNHVIIRVRDDGQGVDLGKVRAKAVDTGLIRPDDRVDRDSIVPLIFFAGFSTREQATDLSGRGIGLDVVSRNIGRLNGQISVDTAEGQGTTFAIKLPLSLAIIPALMAEVGREVYAIPMSAVDESVKVREEDIHIINNREVVRFREKVMPVVRLGEFFGLEGSRRDKRCYLVIVGKAEKSLALAVDRLRGQQEIVIKPLDDTFGKSQGIAGASVLGDGRIVLIIDVLSFWDNKIAKNEQ